MKKTGRIIVISISILLSSFHMFLFDNSLMEVLFFLLAGVIASFFIGRQYDKLQLEMLKRKESEESYKQLVESIPEAVFIHRNGITVYANQAAETMMGAKAKHELIGRSLFDFIDPDYRELAAARIAETLKNKQTVRSTEQKLICLNGETIFFEVSSRCILFEGKESILSIGKDITNQKEATERLLEKSEKLALVGQLAAGIAHEVRNPLTAMKGFIQLSLLEKQYKEDYLKIMLSELERINLIVGEFLMLAKPVEVVFQEKNIKPLLIDVVSLINTQAIMNNIRISTFLPESLPLVSCEENQLKQVFINLLKNAVEAMPDGGEIVIHAWENEQNGVTVTIADQGKGIPADRIPTLGEPFYTTKEKGTGLGLMTCLKIVQAHQGKIKINSELNIGTTFEVSFPKSTVTS